jgi:hypothetical protein
MYYTLKYFQKGGHRHGTAGNEENQWAYLLLAGRLEAVASNPHSSPDTRETTYILLNHTTFS